MAIRIATAPAAVPMTALQAAAHPDPIHLEQALRKNSKLDNSGKDQSGRTPAMVAVASGHPRNVQLVLGLIVPDAKDSLGNTPLHLAIVPGRPQESLAILRMLIGNRPDRHNPRITNSQQNNVVHLAAREGFTDVLRYLFEVYSLLVKACLDTRNVDLEYPLALACRSGALDCMQLCYSHLPHVICMRNNLQHSPLSIAAISGNAAAYRWVRNSWPRDPNVPTVSEELRTAPPYQAHTLLSAVLSHSNLELLQQLLADGANANQPRPNGLTPLLSCFELAAKESQVVPFVAALIEAGADVNYNMPATLPPLVGASALHAAVLKGWHEVVRLLLDAGASLMARQRDMSLLPESTRARSFAFQTPLMLAALLRHAHPCLTVMLGHPSMSYETLVTRSAEPQLLSALHNAVFATNVFALRALLMWLWSHRPDAVQAELEASYSVMGYRLIHIAVAQGHLPTLVELLVWGADPQALSAQAFTPARLAGELFKQHALAYFLTNDPLESKEYAAAAAELARELAAASLPLLPPRTTRSSSQTFSSSSSSSSSSSTAMPAASFPASSGSSGGLRPTAFSIGSAGSRPMSAVASPPASPDSSVGGGGSTTAELLAELDRMKALVAELSQRRPQSSSPLISWSSLTMGRGLGSGAFAKVYEAVWNSTPVAVKLFHQQTMSAEALAEVNNESELMLRLRHPNIVTLIGTVNEEGHVALVMELCVGGSLSYVLHELKHKMSVGEITRTARDVAGGLHYLHSLRPRVIHRDLKSANILLDASGSAKLCDLGLARVKAETLTATNSIGTVQWAAPEQLMCMRTTAAVDIYSFAMVLYELATNEIPFASSRVNPQMLIHPIVNEQRRPPVPANLHPKLVDLMTRSWAHDPARRPSAAEIVGMLDVLAQSREVRDSLIPLQWDFQPSFTSRSGWMQHQGLIPMSSFAIKDHSGVMSAEELSTVQRMLNQLRGGAWEVSRAYAVQNQTLMQRFLAEFRVIQARAEENPELFRRVTWRELPDREEREAFLQQLTDFQARIVDANDVCGGTGAALAQISPIVGLHGVRSEDVAWAIAKSGFAALATLDEGWFGRGMYFTTHADYAAGVYAEPNLDDERAVILSWLLPGNAYPATENPLSTDPLQSLRGQPCRTGYQSHYAVVVPRTDKPGEAGFVPVAAASMATARRLYDELVLFSEAQALPRYLLFLKPKRTAAAARGLAPAPAAALPKGRPGATGAGAAPAAESTTPGRAAPAPAPAAETTTLGRAAPAPAAESLQPMPRRSVDEGGSGAKPLPKPPARPRAS